MRGPRVQRCCGLFRLAFCCCLAVATSLIPVISLAQTARITGQVTEAESGMPLPGVSVRIVNQQDTTHAIIGFTGADGRYAVEHLPAGTYQVTFKSVGYQSFSSKALTIASDETASMDASLQTSPIALDAVVVSASRRAEKALDAPASVTFIDRKEIAEQPAVSPADHLRGVAGVDIAQTGLVQQSVVTRGFNNVATTALTMLTDNRIAAVPSLRINVPYFIPLVDDDIDHVEVVRGPASALYGPNAATGVANIITRSPFASQGTSLSVSGGERSLFQGTLRHAGTLGEDFGFKISGQYFRGNDWEYADPEELKARATALTLGAREDTLKIGLRDPVIERFSGEARIDANLSDQVAANFTAGLNQTVRSIELTDVSAAQAKNWRYLYVQGRVTYGELFAQAYLNQSNAGDTYLLRSGEPVVDRSKQFVAQVQHAHLFSGIERLTYGADMFLTRPVTDGTINGANENRDDINEYGAYVQSETRLAENKVDIVVAGRVDKHNQIENAIFSPRAAIVYRPWENQDFRLTFNRAYSTPATNEFFLDIVSEPNPFGFPSPYEIAIRADGVPSSGFTFLRDDAGRPYMRSTFAPDRSAHIPVDAAATLWPAVVQLLSAQGIDLSQLPAPTPAQIGATMALLNPETSSFEPTNGPVDVPRLKPTITQTLEFGYKGLVGNDLQAGIDLYYSRITDFVGPFQVITPNVFLKASDVKTYLEGFGINPDTAAQIAAAISQIPLGTVTPEQAVDPAAIMLAPRNFGTVSIFGVDLSVDYQLTRNFSFGATYSYADKNFFEKLDGIADIAMNAPRNRGSVNVKYRNPEWGFDAEVRNRWADGFRMSSGVYVGSVGAYSLFDLTLGYVIPGLTNTTFTVTAINVFDRKHQEFVGAPSIGRIAMGRLSYAF